MPFTPATTMLKLSNVPIAIWRTTPPLRRLRIDVVEMLEAGRIFQVAEQREPVAPVVGTGLARQPAVIWPTAEAAGAVSAGRRANQGRRRDRFKESAPDNDRDGTAQPAPSVSIPVFG